LTLLRKENELQLQKMDAQGSLVKQRDKLRRQLVVEENLILIRNSIEWSQQRKEAALMLIKEAISCIIHLENCVGEKLLTMLLMIGANLQDELELHY
jgi:hypothetical protein